MTNETNEGENNEEIFTESASAPVESKVITHFTIWQAAEQWSQKLDDELKAEFAQFVDLYKKLI